MGFRDLFTKNPRKGEADRTKVLVCALDSKFEDVMKTDGEVYSHFYASTEAKMYTSIGELFGAIRERDIVHLFVDVSPTGIIADARGNQITGTDLVQKCGDSDVKLLWVASDNKPDGYIKGFRAVKPLNLVMTLSRNGSNFGTFLDQLLSRMSNGETMPNAWVALSPQQQHASQHAQLPSTIFSAGRGSARFL